MKQQVYFHDLDSIDYKECWDLQERLLTSIVDGKMLNRDKEGESQSQSRHYLLFCEHPHVFTLGKSGSADHLVADEYILKATVLLIYFMKAKKNCMLFAFARSYHIYDFKFENMQLKVTLFFVIRSYLLCDTHIDPITKTSKNLK
jgi:hypothetical protein